MNQSILAASQQYLTESAWKSGQVKNNTLNNSTLNQDFYSQSMNELNQRVTSIRQQHKERPKPYQRSGAKKGDDESEDENTTQKEDQPLDKINALCEEVIQDLTQTIQKLHQYVQEHKQKQAMAKSSGGQEKDTPSLLAKREPMSTDLESGPRSSSAAKPYHGPSGQGGPGLNAKAKDKTSGKKYGAGDGGETIKAEAGEDMASFIQKVESETGGKVSGLAEDPEKLEELDNKQGDEQDAQGTCGLTSTANVLKLAGQKEVTEGEIVKEAQEKGLCTTGSGDPGQDGGSTPDSWKELMASHGVEAEAKKINGLEDIDEAAKEGKGVVLAVSGESLSNDGGGGGGGGGQINHAITVAGTVEKNGESIGYIVCDSAGYQEGKAQFIPKEKMEEATNNGDTDATITEESLKDK